MVFAKFHFFTFNFFMLLLLHRLLNRQSEHSGPRPDSSSLVILCTPFIFTHFNIHIISFFLFLNVNLTVDILMCNCYKTARISVKA